MRTVLITIAVVGMLALSGCGPMAMMWCHVFTPNEDCAP